MSIIENVYYYPESCRYETTVWNRLEKYDHCDEKPSSEKRSFFGRRRGKKSSR